MKKLFLLFAFFFVGVTSVYATGLLEIAEHAKCKDFVDNHRHRLTLFDVVPGKVEFLEERGQSGPALMIDVQKAKILLIDPTTPVEALLKFFDGLNRLEAGFGFNLTEKLGIEIGALIRHESPLVRINAFNELMDRVKRLDGYRGCQKVEFPANLNALLIEVATNLETPGQKLAAELLRTQKAQQGDDGKPRKAIVPVVQVGDRVGLELIEASSKLDIGNRAEDLVAFLDEIPMVQAQVSTVVIEQILGKIAYLLKHSSPVVQARAFRVLDNRLSQRGMYEDMPQLFRIHPHDLKRYLEDVARSADPIGAVLANALVRKLEPFLAAEK